MTTFHFRGSDGGISFAAGDMANAFARVVHAWPVQTGCDGPDGPFAHVSPKADRWTLTTTRPDHSQSEHDPVNAICELVVALNWSRLRQQPGLMCLHAGAVEIDGRLVVFPSGRRAGKSTLTAELTRRGHRLFSDDILAVSISRSGVVEGLATGISPRLRLPLPETAPHPFSRWVAGDPGPANRQYKYLTDAPIAAEGESAPIAAIVTLARKDNLARPMATPMQVAETLPVLIHQNFGRFVHSGRALATFDAMARALPTLRLEYGEFSDAADWIEAQVGGGLLSRQANVAVDPGDVANLDAAAEAKPPRGVSLRYRRRDGFTVVEIDGEAFISDPSGAGIFRMNEGMLPIWHLLESPMRLGDIVDILIEVFPDVSADALQADATQAVGSLEVAGLIERV